jgi:protein-tyrosine-phosphatase
MGLWTTLAAVVLAAVPAASREAEAAAKDTTAPLVVFVCEHGSAKSLVAASHFERLAREQGLAARAVSRGTVPDASVPPAVVELLRGDGFDVAAFQPQALKEADVTAAARVVALGVDLGGLGAKAGARLERWEDVPPFAQGYPQARKVIVSHLEALIREMTAPSPTKR